MKDTINEYGRTIIVVMLFGLFMSIGLGGSWLSALGKASEPEDTNKTLLSALDEREQPKLSVNIPVVSVGDSINFKDYLTATDNEGNDISDNIVIDFKNDNYVDDIFTPVNAGLYLVKISVKDSFNYTTKQTYQLEVIDGDPQYVHIDFESKGFATATFNDKQVFFVDSLSDNPSEGAKYWPMNTPHPYVDIEKVKKAINVIEDNKEETNDFKCAAQFLMWFASEGECDYSYSVSSCCGSDVAVIYNNLVTKYFELESYKDYDITMWQHYSGSDKYHNIISYEYSEDT